MIRHRTREEVRRYDIFKLIVTLILLAVLIILLIRGCSAPSAPAVDESDAASTTEDVGGDEAPAAGDADTDSSAEEADTGADDADDGAAEDEAADDAATEEEEAAPEPEPAPAPILPLIGPLVGGTNIPFGDLSLSGTGEPGTEIEILDGGEVVGTAVVGDDGGWEAVIQPGLGERELSVRPAGDASGTSDPLAVTVFSPPEPADVECSAGILMETTYLVGTCQNLTHIADHIGTTVESLLAANPEVLDPDLIQAGDLLNVP